jgi:hypothetical protein
MNDARRFAPATGRNRDPILEVLRRVVPSNVDVLEIASGSGEHAVFFATRLPIRTWQPSDVDEESRKSIDAWREHEDLSPDVVKPAVRIDVRERDLWKLSSSPSPSVLFCANMIHIAPFECCVGLFEGAARLSSLEKVILYGPFRRHGRHTAPSNEAFDLSLKSRDPSWGVRDLDSEVTSTAEASGFDRSEIVEMPANNLIVVFDRRN